MLPDSYKVKLYNRTQSGEGVFEGEFEKKGLKF